MCHNPLLESATQTIGTPRRTVSRNDFENCVHVFALSLQSATPIVTAIEGIVKRECHRDCNHMQYNAIIYRNRIMKRTKDQKKPQNRKQKINLEDGNIRTARRCNRRDDTLRTSTSLLWTYGATSGLSSVRI